jgi:cardiolipin synthase (CMP-forming)
VPRTRLSRRRLFGLDRSGPAPPQTSPGAPWHPWTIPNAIGFVRVALIPVFLVLDYHSRHGTDVLAAMCFFIAGAGDYLDGITARVTGQYSRLGAALDPLIDRSLVLAGAAVCWSYELLPRWALGVLAARELLMLLAGQAWIRRGFVLRINWPGRLAVGPTLFGIWLGLLDAGDVGRWFLFGGLTLAWIATFAYLRDGATQISGSSSA